MGPRLDAPPPRKLACGRCGAAFDLRARRRALLVRRRAVSFAYARVRAGSPDRPRIACAQAACGRRRGPPVELTGNFLILSLPTSRTSRQSMIIANESDVTKAVLSELQRAPNARFKGDHVGLCAPPARFVREAKLTGRNSTLRWPTWSRSASTARDPQRGGADGGLARRVRADLPDQHTATTARSRPTTTCWAVLAHAFPGHAERRLDRALADAGPVLLVDASFRDRAGKPVTGVEVDIWQSSPEGFYENQDPVQADMNLRGKFLTDGEGRISFRSVKPAGYPIPIDGPTGDLLRAQGRHNMRPAHLHFLASKDGFKTLISQIYVQDDKFLDTDVQFGVTRHLIGNFVRHENEAAPAPERDGAVYSLTHDFVMEPGATKLPRPPISGKARGERPKIPHLA